jgi:hypothetical protein
VLGIVLGTRDIAMNKTDKMPIFRGSISQWRSRVNKTKTYKVRIYDAIEKNKAEKKIGSTGGGVQVYIMC